MDRDQSIEDRDGSCKLLTGRSNCSQLSTAATHAIHTELPSSQRRSVSLVKKIEPWIAGISTCTIYRVCLNFQRRLALYLYLSQTNTLLGHSYRGSKSAYVFKVII